MAEGVSVSLVVCLSNFGILNRTKNEQCLRLRHGNAVPGMVLCHAVRTYGKETDNIQKEL